MKKLGRVLAVAAAIVATTVLATPLINFPAVDGGRFTCYVDGVAQEGTHTQESTASARLANLKLNNPDADVYCSQTRTLRAVLTAAGREFVRAANAAVIVTAPPSGFTQQQKDDDFAARATDSTDVLYATNFDDVYLDGAADVARSGITTDQDLIDEALESPTTPANVSVNTSIRLSGANSVRLTTLGSSAASSGGYWAFRPDGRTATTRTRLYVQFSVYYPQETIGYRFDHGGDSYLKTINLGQYGAGQVVIGDDRFSGFPVVLINGTGTIGGTYYQYTSGQNPWGITTNRESPAIDNGATVTAGSTKEAWLNNYGVMPRGVAAQDGDYGYDSADPYLYERAGMTNGWPDTRSTASGAVPWQRDGWTTVEAFLEYNGDGNVSTVQIWAAPYGEAPTLMVNEVGTIDLNVAGSNAWSRFELLNYATGRNAEGTRPTQYTYYDEVIVSTGPIDFPNPGGTPHTLPSNQGTAQNALEDLVDTLAAGAETNYTDMQPSTWPAGNYDWAHEAGYYVAGELVHILGNRHAHDYWSHAYFDLASEQWTYERTDEPAAFAGHVYGGFALDPDTGDVYHWDEIQTIERYTQSTGSWDFTTSANTSLSGSTDRKNGMAYHPNLYGAGDGGLIVFHRYDGMWAWRKSTDTWEEIGSGLGGGYREGIGIYDPANDVAYVGGGGAGTGGADVFKISPNGGSTPTATNLGVLPLTPRAGATITWLLPDPLETGKMYLLAQGASTWYVSTDQGANWTAKALGHPFSDSYQITPIWGKQGFLGIQDQSAVVWKPDE